MNSVSAITKSVDNKNTGYGYAVVTLLLLLVLGSIERIYGIDRQSLWSDELYAVVASYKSSYMDVWRLMLGDSHPPGYLSFMYVTLPLTGYTDFGVRLHALVFGVVWIPLVFWFGRRWFSTNAALLAAAVVASAYNAVYYSQEARAYTMLIVFNLLNLICLFEILFSENRLRRNMVGFIFSSLAMLYLHYTGFVFISAEILLYFLLWISGLHRGSLREAAILFGVPLLLYSPWLGVMYANLTNAPHDWSVSKVPTLAEVYNTMQRLLGPDDSHMRFHVWAVAAAASVAAVLHKKQGLSRPLLVVYCLFFLMVVPILAFYIESLIATPIFEKRYFLAALVIEALLIAWAASQILSWVIPRWKNTITVMAVIAFSAWTINANVQSGLYSNKDKDPVRDAVEVIRNDLNKNALAKHYTTIMTHDWFEPYLRAFRVNFDPEWESRKYYVPQQISNIEDYLSKHKGKAYLYYLSLRQPNAEAALVALKQQYKLLSQASVSIEAGTIDIFKFSVKELPDEKQLAAVGTNPSNEIAKLVAQDIGGKPASTYRILMTHTWMQPYLERNGVAIDKDWDVSYVINAQADHIYDYIKNNPEVETLYYLALQEPNAEGAAFMLQSRYFLADEKSMQTSVGKMNIFKFNVKAAPVINESLLQKMRASQTDQVAKWILGNVESAKPETYAVAMANDWIAPYLALNGVPVDDTWPERKYYIETSAQNVVDYIDKHPAIDTLYYVALREPNAENAALMLQAQYRLLDKATIDVAAGKIDIYKLDVKLKPIDTSSIREKMASTPLNDIVAVLASDIDKRKKSSSTVIMTHSWFQPYLNLHDVSFDAGWPGRFFIQPDQVADVTRYLELHPGIDHVYYLGLAEPNLQIALDEIKKQMPIGCKKFIAAPVGQLKLIRFDVKKPLSPAGSEAGICGG